MTEETIQIVNDNNNKALETCNALITIINNDLVDDVDVAAMVDVIRDYLKCNDQMLDRMM